MEGPAERRELPESVSRITIDDNALWEDLCDPDQWLPLITAIARFAQTYRSPESLSASSLDPGEWNLAHLTVVFELERLNYLLLARQLSDRIRDLSWEEPLSSLLHGLDRAVASAMETGRLLAAETLGEIDDSPAPLDRFAVPDDEEELPEWGQGYAFVLMRRFVAEVHAALELREAVCREAYEDQQ